MNWKHLMKVVGIAAIGGGAISAGQAAADTLAHAGGQGAVIAGIITTVLAAYMKPPHQD